MGVSVVDGGVGGGLPGVLPTMQSRLAEAHLLVGQFPATLTAWQEGRIEAGHVRTIMLHGGSIDEADARAQYEGIVLQQATLVYPGRLAKHAQLTATRVGNVSFETATRRRGKTAVCDCPRRITACPGWCCICRPCTRRRSGTG